MKTRGTIVVLVVSAFCVGGYADDGLIARWTFEEGVGSIVGDVSGNGHDGTAMGGFTFSTDTPPGTSSQFSGYFAGVGYVTVPDAAALDPTEDFTMAAWVKAVQASGHNFMLIKHFHGTNEDGSWFYDLSCYGPAKQYFIATPWEYGADDPNGFPLYEWHHVAISYQDGTDTVRLYTDGVLVHTEVYVADIADNAATLGIGGTGDGTGGNLHGWLDDVRMYSRALTDQEIYDLAHPVECWSWDGTNDPGFQSSFPAGDPNSDYDPNEHALRVAYGQRTGINVQTVYYKELPLQFDDFVMTVYLSIPDLGYWVDPGFGDQVIPYSPTFQLADLRTHLYRGPAGRIIDLETCDYDTNHNIGYLHSGQHPQQGQRYRVLMCRAGTQVGARVDVWQGGDWQYVGAVGPVSRPGLTEPFHVLRFDQPEYGDYGEILVDSIEVCRSPAPTTGDLNCDGVVDFDDIDPLIEALSGPANYYAGRPRCNWLAGDCDGNGTVDFDDIDPFVALLSQ